MSVTLFFRDTGTVQYRAYVNQLVCTHNATVITAGGKRSSVTSEPDSLITNAAKDLLVYQSEPEALPFPSGHASHYHEPVGPCDPDSSSIRPGHTRASPTPVNVNAHMHTFDTHINSTLRFVEYTHMFMCAQADTQTNREILQRHTCKHPHTLTRICCTH